MMHDFIRYGYIWYRVRVGVTHRIRGTSDSEATSSIVVEVVEVVEVVVRPESK